MVSTNNPTLERLALGRLLANEMRESQGRNLRAFGVMGSVARGTAQKYSDLDLLVIVRRNPESIPRSQIRNNIYCSLNPETWTSAIKPITNPYEPHNYIPEILGGLTRIKPLYDPEKLMPRLEKIAKSVPGEIFRKSADLALAHSYEDFCRAKNAVMHMDEIVLKETIRWTMHSASNIVASLNNTHFESDREIYKAYKNWKKLPRGFNTILKLQYGGLKGTKLFNVFLSFYIELVRFCQNEGINFPVSESAMRKL